MSHMTRIQSNPDSAVNQAVPHGTAIRRILVTAYGHIADVLPAFAGIHALRQNYPDAHITVLAVEYVREMFEQCADVDEVLVMKDIKHKGTRLGKLEQLERLARLLPRVYRRYDMVLVLHARTPFVTRLAWLSGARIRAGFTDVGSPRMLTHPAHPLKSFVSFREENRRVLAAVGITGMGTGLEFTPTADDVGAMRRFLAAEGAGEGDILIGLHPGSHWTCQQWDITEWSALADELVTRFGARIVITGSPDEGELAQALVEHMHTESSGVINAVGRTSIMQFAALLSSLTCLVCVNSAASQIALAVRVPVVNLVGYENPVWTAPAAGEPMVIVRGCDDSTALASWCPFNVWGHVSECHRPQCVGIGGMSLIQRERVTREVEKWLLRSQQPARRAPSVGPGVSNY
jgi:heptosyltransferase II